MIQTQTPDPDLLEAWSFDVSGQVSPAIRKECLRYLREYGRDVGPLPAATTFGLRRFMADRVDRWSPSTLQIVRRAFRSFFRWAEVNGVWENVAAGLPPIKAPEVVVRVAGADIRTRLVAACHSVRDRAIIDLIFGSGARRCEVAALRLADVDQTAGTISIAKSKTGRPRVAPLDFDARASLAAWLEERGEQPVDALWTTSLGRPLSSHGLKTRLRRLAERADVVWTSHDARRGFATEWLRRGGSEVGLQAAAGWTSTAMIARYTRTHRQELALAEARRLFG